MWVLVLFIWIILVGDLACQYHRGYLHEKIHPNSHSII
jgi:hypothetical protein